MQAVLQHRITDVMARTNVLMSFFRRQQQPQEVAQVRSTPVALPPEVTHGDTWPVYAVVAVAVKLTSRIFGGKERWESHYFGSEVELQAFLEQLKESIEACEWKYTAKIAVYEWRHGPNFREALCY